MKFKIVSLMPDLIEGALSHGVVGSAFKKGLCELQLINPRTFTENVHQTVDDRPFGGGDGMLMMSEPLQKALDSLSEKGSVYYLSPQGKKFDNEVASQMALLGSVTFICGRYGGLDQRFLNHNEVEEISIGDYVLSGGELAALVLIDACVRKIPGVLGHGASATEDSFENRLLEAPSYTRPREWQGQTVPEVLLSGDPKKIQKFKSICGLLVTLQKRPDLLKNGEWDYQGALRFLLNLSEEDLRVLGLTKEPLHKKLEEKLNA